MPHSSGGGSSHEGSHSGSGFSGSSSSSSSSSNGTTYRRSQQYFPGSRVYVRYVNRRPTYMYSNGSLTRSNFTQVAIFLCIWLFIGAISNLVGSVHFVTKLSSSGVSSTTIDIDDNLGVLGDTTALMQSLENFKEETGIIPAVVTVDKSEWYDEYPSLEQFAYNWYTYNYSDEKHWLIIYSADLTADDRFGDWYWEAMQGSYTDSILSYEVTSEFTSMLHQRLTASNSYTTAEAIASSIDDISEGLMGLNMDWLKLAGGVLSITAGAVIIVISKKLKQKEKEKYGEYQEVKNVQMGANNVPLEDICAYCDGVYAVGTVYNCPHCGAAIPAHNPINRQ